MEAQQRRMKGLVEAQLSEETTTGNSKRGGMSVSTALDTDTGYTKLKWNVPLQRRNVVALKDEEKFVSRRQIDYDRCLCKEFCGIGCVNRKLNIECHADNCYFDQFKDCSNRRLAKGPKQNLEVFDTQSVRGLGLRSKEAIKAGEFVIEYIGEILKLTTNEGEKRYYANISEGKFYMMELENNIYIDASRFGNQARFINHSCHPNCIVERWNIHGEEKVCIFASKNIRVGEELTYNYDFDYWPQAMECHCGAFHCISKKNRLKVNRDSSAKKRRRISKGSMRTPRKQHSSKTQEAAHKRSIPAITTQAIEQNSFKVKCEVDIPQMYLEFIRMNLEKYKCEFDIVYPQTSVIQSPHKVYNLQLKAKDQKTLELLYSQICRLVDTLQYRVVEVEKDLQELLNPLLETIRNQSKGSFSFAVGVDKSSLKTISRIQFARVTFGLYVVARRVDFEWIFSYFQKELDSLVSDYFVVPLSDIAVFYERLQQIDRKNLIIKQEAADAKSLVVSIKGKRFEAIKVKSELTRMEEIPNEEQELKSALKTEEEGRPKEYEESRNDNPLSEKEYQKEYQEYSDRDGHNPLTETDKEASFEHPPSHASMEENIPRTKSCQIQTDSPSSQDPTDHNIQDMAVVEAQE